MAAVAKAEAPPVRERPILFSAPMVRAILAGAKTQTRRIVTVPWKGSRRSLPYEPYYVDEDGRLLVDTDAMGGPGSGRGHLEYSECVACPYGAPGDRLWVKETWRPDIAHGHGYDACDCADVNVTYGAD